MIRDCTEHCVQFTRVAIGDMLKPAEEVEEEVEEAAEEQNNIQEELSSLAIAMDDMDLW
eukprot:IDg11524t1